MRPPILWHTSFSAGNPGVRFPQTGVAYAGRTLYTAFVLGFFFGGFFSCVVLGGVDRLFEDFFVSSDSRIVRESPPVKGWHSLDGNLPIWAVRGCPPVVRLAHPGWNPFHLVAGSITTSQSRQELLGSAAQPGPPFFLDFVVYASCSFFFGSREAVAMEHPAGGCRFGSGPCCSWGSLPVAFGLFSRSCFFYVGSSSGKGAKLACVEAQKKGHRPNNRQ